VLYFLVEKAMVFEWEPAKAERNLHKQGVSFAEAGTVFSDDLSITVSDPDHSDEEDRYITIGWSHNGSLLLGARTDRKDKI
jgi:uncharacterized DUF497 family protein